MNKEMKGKVKETEVDKAKRLINEEKDARSKTCMDEVNDVLKKHNCDLMIAGRFQGNQIESQVLIIAKD